MFGSPLAGGSGGLCCGGGSGLVGGGVGIETDAGVFDRTIDSLHRSNECVHIIISIKYCTGVQVI